MMAKIKNQPVAKKPATAKKAQVKKVTNTVPAPGQEKKEIKAVAPEQPEVKAMPICVVIPYLHSKEGGEELRYALRAWEKHLPEVQIVLIGDKPDYVSNLVHHIPALAHGGNPQSDVAIKLMQAIASDQVPDAFILSNDDIYPIADVDLELLVFPFCNGQLGEKRNATTGYAEKTERTKAILEAEGLPTFDYGTHLPVAYEKGLLAELIAKHKAEEVGLLISSLYFNTFAKDVTPEVTKGNVNGSHVAYIYRDNPNLTVLEEVFKTRKYVNHNSAGYAATLPFLQKQFPEVSKFEK